MSAIFGKSQIVKKKRHHRLRTYKKHRASIVPDIPIKSLLFILVAAASSKYAPSRSLAVLTTVMIRFPVLYAWSGNRYTRKKTSTWNNAKTVKNKESPIPAIVRAVANCWPNSWSCFLIVSRLEAEGDKLEFPACRFIEADGDGGRGSSWRWTCLWWKLPSGVMVKFLLPNCPSSLAVSFAITLNQ